MIKKVLTILMLSLICMSVDAQTVTTKDLIGSWKLIVEKGVNSVEADRSTMIMSPRKFEAVGNVKTNIEQNNGSDSKNEMEFSL